jgi:hypothetical protein
MSTHKESTAHGDESKVYGIIDILRASHRYSEELRERDRRDQRQGWIWFSLLVVLVGLLVGFCAWIGH